MTSFATAIQLHYSVILKSGLFTVVDYLVTDYSATYLWC